MMDLAADAPHYIDFDVPLQETWQPCAFFPDGQRVLFLSMEARRDGPGRPFAEISQDAYSLLDIRRRKR